MQSRNSDITTRFPSATRPGGAFFPMLMFLLAIFVCDGGQAMGAGRRAVVKKGKVSRMEVSPDTVHPLFRQELELPDTISDDSRYAIQEGGHHLGPAGGNDSVRIETMVGEQKPGLGAPSVEMRRHVGDYRKPGVYYPDLSPQRPEANRDWWHLLKKGKLSMQDSTVRWPRFLKFCVNVYNWGDRFFNGFDTTYVVGTGRRWKARLMSDLWSDSYVLDFRHGKPITMLSEPIVHSGAYLQYMAVSLGYQIDMSNVIGNRPINNRRFNFGFSCGLFSAEMSFMSNDGGTMLRRFGNYNGGHRIHHYLKGLSMSTVETDVYFFLNHRKYSQVAAYSFGRYQKKRAGSFMLGFTYLNQDIKMDFTTLPPEMWADIPMEHRKLNFHYNNYNLLAGYGYNWPVGRHLLFNVTLLPAVGFNNAYEDTTDLHTKMLSLGFRGQTSVTYNYGDCFVGLAGRITGQFYYSRSMTLFSSIETGTLTCGVRF